MCQASREGHNRVRRWLARDMTYTEGYCTRVARESHNALAGLRQSETPEEAGFDRASVRPDAVWNAGLSDGLGST